ncbi:PIR Superfamily Protein [Plasmodium ovale curtisi]|uniref:PIR Superfamily Protein n=1 Tax=Plasmodium ovale curtisi TaxID=864141 RepID=A0A1A8X9H9_PLAOA|nr:PIR Superfamily Protein [Plasmodium ovale curtisi]
MSPDIDDTAFWPSIKELTISKNENLGNMYRKFEDMCSLDDNKKYCLIDKDEYNISDNVQKLHNNLYGNKVKYDASNAEFSTFYEYPKKFCFFFKYWLYDQIILKKISDSQINEVLKTLNNGGKFQFVMAQNYTCNFNILKLDKIKEMKLLFDYIGNYDTKKKKSAINDKICDSAYKGTINNMISLYNDRHMKCGKASNEYCTEFDECMEIFNVHKLCKLQCSEERAHSMEEQSVCSILSSFPHDSSQPYPPDGKLQEESIDGHNENPSISITMTVIPILLTILVAFPILYKITPFGPWLRKSITKTKNFLFNTYENSNDTLFNRVSESDNVNLMERQNYIAYHSSRQNSLQNSK